MRWTNRLQRNINASVVWTWFIGIAIIIVGLWLTCESESMIPFVAGLILGAVVIELGLNSLALLGTVMEMSYNLESLTHNQQTTGVDSNTYPNAYTNTASAPNLYANTTGYANAYANTYTNTADASNPYANTTGYSDTYVDTTRP